MKEISKEKQAEVRIKEVSEGNGNKSVQRMEDDNHASLHL